MEYGEEKLGICPYCGNGDIEYGETEIDGNRYYYDFTCNKCGGCGYEEYILYFKRIVFDTY